MCDNISHAQLLLNRECHVTFEAGHFLLEVLNLVQGRSTSEIPAAAVDNGVRTLQVLGEDFVWPGSRPLASPLSAPNLPCGGARVPLGGPAARGLALALVSLVAGHGISPGCGRRAQAASWCLPWRRRSQQRRVSRKARRVLRGRRGRRTAGAVRRWGRPNRKGIGKGGTFLVRKKSSTAPVRHRRRDSRSSRGLPVRAPGAHCCPGCRAKRYRLGRALRRSAGPDTCRVIVRVIVRRYAGRG